MSKVALVTGASRGIGKATAIALAERGFDVAITARTQEPGEPTAIAPESGVVLPGSLSETARAIEAVGQRCLKIRLDLLERETLAPAVDEVVDAWGRLDVLINNAIYVGPGNTDLFVTVDPEHIIKRVWCNLTAQLLITQRALQVMSGRGGSAGDGSAGANPLDTTPPGGDPPDTDPLGDHPPGGVIINLSSMASFGPALKLSEQGASGLIYSTTKAGLNRLAPCLAQEHEGQNIQVLSVDPGVVITERVDAAGSRLRLVREMGGAPPEPAGKALAWIADGNMAGHDPTKIIAAQEIARQLGLL